MTPHEALVEKVARKLVYHYQLEDGYGELSAQSAAKTEMWRNFRKTAIGVLALIAEETKEATEEQARAFYNTIDAPSFQWSAMHRASALWPES